jgi:hypothetical protein
MQPVIVKEQTAKRLAYGLMAWFLLTVVFAILDESLWPLAAITGLAAGMWNGRYAEATAVRRGRGIVLNE